MNKISVALCTYNGADFLSEQLESFLAQTRPPDELVVGDDCSSDETVKIIEDFAAAAPFPVLLQINEKNVGSTANFEQTISRCAGDIIFLADQDDVWRADKIARMETKFDAEKDAALIFSDAELIDENSKSLGRNLWNFTFPEAKRKAARAGKMFEVLLEKNVVTGATAAFRASYREIFMPVPKDVPNLIHDGWIALALAADDAKINFIDEPLIKYRQHARQQLGINFQFVPIKNYPERQKYYADSIEFLEGEKARLRRLKKIFAAHPQFENHLKNDLTEKFVAEKQQLANHYAARRGLSPNRAKRLMPIVRELSSGRYRRFSKGWLSAAKDLFEKWETED